jgi:hypothetical protein
MSWKTEAPRLLLRGMGSGRWYIGGFNAVLDPSQRFWLNFLAQLSMIQKGSNFGELGD